MKAKSLLLLLTTIAVALAGTAHSQIQRPGVGPSNPNRQNQDLETLRQIQFMDQQHRLDELRKRDAQSQHSQQGHGADPARDQAIVRAQVAKFMEAIKHRKHLSADFDQVVTHGQTLVTPDILSLGIVAIHVARKTRPDAKN